MKKNSKTKSIKILIASLLCGLAFTCVNVSAMESDSKNQQQQIPQNSNDNLSVTNNDNENEKLNANEIQKPIQESNSESNPSYSFDYMMKMQSISEQADLAKKFSSLIHNKNQQQQISQESNDNLNRNANIESTTTKKDQKNLNKNIEEKYETFNNLYEQFKEKAKNCMLLKEMKPYYDTLVKEFLDLYYKIPKTDGKYSEIIKEMENKIKDIHETYKEYEIDYMNRKYDQYENLYNELIKNKKRCFSSLDFNKKCKPLILESENVYKEIIKFINDYPEEGSIIKDKLKEKHEKFIKINDELKEAEKTCEKIYKDYGECIEIYKEFIEKSEKYDNNFEDNYEEYEKVCTPLFEKFENKYEQISNSKFKKYMNHLNFMGLISKVCEVDMIKKNFTEKSLGKNFIQERISQIENEEKNNIDSLNKKIETFFKQTVLPQKEYKSIKKNIYYGKINTMNRLNEKILDYKNLSRNKIKEIEKDMENIKKTKKQNIKKKIEVNAYKNIVASLKEILTHIFGFGYSKIKDIDPTILNQLHKIYKEMGYITNCDMPPTKMEQIPGNQEDVTINNINKIIDQINMLNNIDDFRYENIAEKIKGYIMWNIRHYRIIKEIEKMKEQFNNTYSILKNNTEEKYKSKKS